LQVNGQAKPKRVGNVYVKSIISFMLSIDVLVFMWYETLSYVL